MDVDLHTQRLTEQLTEKIRQMLFLRYFFRLPSNKFFGPFTTLILLALLFSLLGVGFIAAVSHQSASNGEGNRLVGSLEVKAPGGRAYRSDPS
jgi:hypothetical protein